MIGYVPPKQRLIQQLKGWPWQTIEVVCAPNPNSCLLVELFVMKGLTIRPGSVRGRVGRINVMDNGDGRLTAHIADDPLNVLYEQGVQVGSINYITGRIESCFWNDHPMVSITLEYQYDQWLGLRKLPRALSSVRTATRN